MSLTKDEGLAAYRTMLRIRRFDEEMPKLVVDGVATGEVHQYIGQEAVATGICHNLEVADVITSTHRGHGHLIAKGGDLKLMIAEIGGRTTGYCKGKGGSMHITSRELGIYGTNGMVGQGVPIGVGAAFAMKYRDQPQVAVSFYGEGASNEGSVHEGMNLAAIYQLPMVFVVENNRYAVTFPVEQGTSGGDIAARAAGYGMPGYSVDGMDFHAVNEVAKEAIAKVRAGEGPCLIEARTYRYFGHFGSEGLLLKKAYRTEEEVDSYRERDPIPALAKRLADDFGVSDEELEKINDEVMTEINDGIAFMHDSPFPAVADGLDDAYAVPHATMPIRGW